MQGKNSTIAEIVLLSLKRHLNIKEYRTLATYFDVRPGTLYSWKKRGKIGDIGAILSKCPYISPNWLKTGKGPMMIVDKNNIDQLPSSWSNEEPEPTNHKVAATIEPGNNRQRHQVEKIKKETPSSDKDQSLPMTKLMYMTSAVLESKTEYKTALESNIKAFYEAVKNEEEMKLVRKELKEIHEENHEMADRMTRMEEMLESLGASVPQKRDSKTG